MIFDPQNITVEKFQELFDTEKKARDFLEFLRWGGIPECPHCGSKRSYPNGCGIRYKCAGCGKKYSVALKSMLNHSRVGLKNWLFGLFIYQKSKGRILTGPLADILNVSDDTAFMMKSRLGSVFDSVNKNGKNSYEIFCQAVLNFFTLRACYLPKSDYIKSAYHIDGYLDISDRSTYDLLLVYTRRRLMYSSYIYCSFISAEEALNEAFLTLSEYPETQRTNGQFIVKVINRTISRLWYYYQKANPVRYKRLLNYRKEWKREARQELKAYYLTQLANNCFEKVGAEKISVQEMRSDSSLVSEIKERVLKKRNKSSLDNY